MDQRGRTRCVSRAATARRRSSSDRRSSCGRRPHTPARGERGERRLAAAHDVSDAARPPGRPDEEAVMAVEERNVVEAAVVDAVLDYFEGWFDGDAGRMERALHPGLAKRGLEKDG